jgi:predicted DNA-binding transcriptional regulator YafY
MAEKKNLYQSYGQKLISLFVRLLFSGKKYSLTELAKLHDCSKQTILRLIDDLDRSYKIELEQTKEGNKHYYRIKRPHNTQPIASLSDTELSLLEMCRDFTAQLLGKKIFEDVSLAIMKNKTMESSDNVRSSTDFATIKTGTIDYTAHQETICTLIGAMKQKKLCQVSYQAIMEARANTFIIMPLKLFSYKDALYIHARRVSINSLTDVKQAYDPLLAVHRIIKVKMMDKSYESPDNYDFEKLFNKQFGIIKDQTFVVEVEFSGWAAKYVAERQWSPKQKIKIKNKDKTVLEFKASSEQEVLSWVLSFGAEARLIKPKMLINKIKYQINYMQHNY